MKEFFIALVIALAVLFGAALSSETGGVAVEIEWKE